MPLTAVPQKASRVGHTQAGARRARARGSGLLRLEARAGREAPVDCEGQHRHADVHGHGQKLRARHAERGNRDEGREQGAPNGAQGVQAIEPGHAIAQLIVTRHHELGERGQRRAHEERGDDQSPEGQQRAQQIERWRHTPRFQRRCHVEAVDASQERRQGQREDRHPEFEASVDGEGPPQPPGEPSETEAAEGEPRHERGEHDARGLEAGAEDERQVADPRDLVDERGATGQQK
jgi:hypothetical protein